MILNKIKCIIGRQNLKYGFLDFINTSNSGSPGFAYAVNGGGYITFIQKDLILTLLHTFYLN